MPKLTQYRDMLERWNRAFNLCSRKAGRADLDALCALGAHVADFIAGLPLPAEPLIWDLGAGAGLPGIPLRLRYPQGEYWLVEARARRALFLSNVLARLGLERTYVFRGRAGDFAAVAGAAADLILSQAFMPWPELLPLARPWLAGEGFLLVLSSRAAPDDPALLQGFALHSCARRSFGGRQRHIWALQRAGS